MIKILIRVCIVLLCVAQISMAQTLKQSDIVASSTGTEKNFGWVKTTLYDDLTNKRSTWNISVPHRVADRSFWLTQIAVEASTIVDIENTQWCIRTNRCTELNPIFFSRTPSRARMYGITSAINALAGYMAWRSKRIEDAQIAFGARPQQPRWYTIPWIVAVSHTVGIAWTIHNTGR